jgi:predicted RNA-binding protein
MCEANVFLSKDDKEEMVMESVDVLKPLEDNQWFVKNIFGEQMKIKGNIQYVSLINHKIVFKED